MQGESGSVGILRTLTSRVGHTLSFRIGMSFLCYCLVCSSCYIKIPQTGWLRNTRKLFLTRLEAGKSKIQAPTDSVAGENLLQLHMAKGAQDFSEASFLSGMRVTSSPAKGPTCKHRQDSTHESGGEIQRFSPQHLLL